MTARQDDSLTDAQGVCHAAFTGEARIISLIPSITELICDLDLGAQLVGRTGFCIHPRDFLRSVTKVGGTKDLKLDVIRQLAPTHVIADMDENRKEQVDALREFVPHIVVIHPKTVSDNLALYRLLGGIFQRESQAAILCERLIAARQALHLAVASLPTEAVLYPIWREPWMTISRPTYIAAMLAEAGWHALPGDAAQRYPGFVWSTEDSPWLTQVQRVLLPSEPYHFQAEHQREIKELCAALMLPDLAVHSIDGEMVSWYGSRAILGLTYLRELRQSLADTPHTRQS